MAERDAKKVAAREREAFEAGYRAAEGSRWGVEQAYNAWRFDPFRDLRDQLRGEQ